MGRHRSHRPQIAVIIPTYNRSATIGRAINSVFLSDEPDLEVIVVDDGSTDNTADCVAGYRDERLRYIRQDEHRNGNVARNRGVAAASAPLIAFLDSDDEFLAGRPGRLIEFFKSHPEIDVTLDAFSVQRAGKWRSTPLPGQTPTRSELIRFLVAHAIPLTTSAICLRRSALDAIGGFDERLVRQQDRDLLLRLAKSSLVAMGTGNDVLKHQSVDSFSRLPAGYIDGLDALVGRHGVFSEPANADLLSYLTSRVILAALLRCRLPAAYNEYRALVRARHLPYGFLTSLMRYNQGKSMRRYLEKQIADTGERVAIAGSGAAGRVVGGK